jgi:ferredoxin
MDMEQTVKNCIAYCKGEYEYDDEGQAVQRGEDGEEEEGDGSSGAEEEEDSDMDIDDGDDSE